MEPSTFTAFDFDALPKLTRDDVAAQARFRAAPTSEIASALAAVIGADVAIRFLYARAPEPVAGVLVAFSDGERALLLEAEPALAREVVARTLKHEAGIADGATPSREGVAGAFAAIVHHALRRIADAPLRSVDPSAVKRELVISLAIDLGGATYGARLAIPPSAGARAPASLDFPLSLPLATSCVVERAAIETLETGDVLLPPNLLRAAPFALIAPASERGIGVECSAECDSGPRLVIRNDATMAMDTNANLDAALDAPVVVRVELGAVEMKAREWAALNEGDVITLQRKLGEPAILRIAGQEVARGELVQVDGEYGIRITSTNR